MQETVYSAEAELRHPLRFLGEAWRDLRRSPSIAWQLFRSSTRARHRRVWLGYLWLLLPTLGATAIWWYVRSRGIIGIGNTGLPYVVYALSGTMLWQVFAESLASPLQQLTNNRALVTKSRVPHEALLLAGVYETLLNCGARLLILAAVMVAVQVRVGWEIALVPLGVAALVLLGLALGLVASSAGLLYEDVGRGLAMVTGFWFFLTPVVYPTPVRGLLRFNPVTPLLDTTRRWLTSPADASAFVPVIALALVLLVAAWLLHRLARAHVVATLG